MKKHGDTEARRELRKYEGCVMKDETIILVSSFSSIILPPSSFFSVPLCLRVFYILRAKWKTRIYF